MSYGINNNVTEEQHLIIKAIWDYNEIFRRRFGSQVVSHVFSKEETCAVPFIVLSKEGETTQSTLNYSHEIAKLFFFAYSALCSSNSRSNNNITKTPTTSHEENNDEQQFNFIFGEGKESSLIEKIAHHYIVCLFLPHYYDSDESSSNNSNSNTLMQRLKIKFPTMHQSKESGMIWKTNRTSTSMSEQLYEKQFDLMKTKHMWKMERIHGKDTRVFSQLNDSNGKQSSTLTILKTATDNFEDFCKYFEIACEFASGQEMNNSLRKHLFDIYINQIQLERMSGKPLSDYVIILENDKIASAGMIVYGNELESEDYKEHSNCAAIYGIATREKYRGRGYATMIVITLIELAKSRGYDRVILHASESGCSLYSKLGFEKRVSIDVCSIALFLDE